MSRETRTKRKEVEKARRDKMSELMRDYDETVFYPALKAVKAECADVGHGSKHNHDNGLGWNFITCLDCGAMLEKHGPNGELIKP
ncbi:hypothetical protein V0M98_34050 (plasmid) [Pseudomonas silesiensis]|uniref:hypothetical protein n=1 Tax=Pseudomonas silesiensis TaxID=1853130 RepID=UPI0030D4501C